MCVLFVILLWRYCCCQRGDDDMKCREKRLQLYCDRNGRKVEVHQEYGRNYELNYKVRMSTDFYNPSLHPVIVHTAYQAHRARKRYTLGRSPVYQRAFVIYNYYIILTHLIGLHLI